MEANVVLHLDGQWTLLEAGKRTQPVTDYPRLEAPAYVLTDFNGALSGVSVINGRADYAAPLIERHLRDDGLVDEETKVLIHHGARTLDGYQVLYTAVPTNVWQRLQSWAQAQPEHCLVIPQTALMYRLLGNERPGVVFRSGRRFACLVRQKNALTYASVLAFGDSEEYLRISIKALSDRIGEQLAEKKTIVGSLKTQWFSAGRPASADESSLAAYLKECSGLDVFLDETESPVAKGRSHTAAPATSWQSSLSPVAAINPIAAKIGFFAEKHLLRFSALIGIAALVMAAWGIAVWIQSIWMEERLVQDKVTAEEIRATIQRDGAIPPLPKDFYPTRDLINLLFQAQSGISAYDFLRELSTAAGRDVKLLRVQMNPSNHSLIVEGWVDQRGGNDRPLADFIARLRQQGFSPSAIDTPAGTHTRRNGYFAYQLIPAFAKE